MLKALLLVPLGAVGLFLVGIPFLLFKSFVAMLLVGAVHSEVFAWVPALGFFQTFLVVWALAAVLPTPVSNTTSRS